jgi:cell division protein FtsX
MISEHERLAAFRRDLEQQEQVSTDPEWVRRQMDKHQYSRTFCIVLAFIGALAAYGILLAVASI